MPQTPVLIPVAPGLAVVLSEYGQVPVQFDGPQVTERLPHALFSEEQMTLSEVIQEPSISAPQLQAGMAVQELLPPVQLLSSQR